MTLPFVTNSLAVTAAKPDRSWDDPTYAVAAHQATQKIELLSLPAFEVPLMAAVARDDRISLINPGLWQKCKLLQDSLGPKMSNYSDAVSPVGDLGKSIFCARPGIKLANMDRIFGITQSNYSYFEKQDGAPLSFVDLCGGPGSYTQYIQYRRPNSLGWGMTLRAAPGASAADAKRENDWDLSALNTDPLRFNIIDGQANASGRYGDLKLNCLLLASKVLGDTAGVGVDCVVADGWIEATQNFSEQEVLNTDLVLVECCLGILLTAVGGNFVCKVTDVVRERSAQIMYLLAQAFTYFTVFKPISSRPASAEKYLICLNRRGGDSFGNYRSKMQQLLEYTVQNRGIPPGQLCVVPKDFHDWVVDMNNWHIEYQFHYIEQIAKLIDAEARKTSADRRIPSLDIERAYVFWCLPGAAGITYEAPAATREVINAPPGAAGATPPGTVRTEYRNQPYRGGRGRGHDGQRSDRGRGEHRGGRRDYNRPPP